MARKVDQSLTYMAQEVFPSATVICESGSDSETWILEVVGEPTIQLGRHRDGALLQLLQLIEQRQALSRFREPPLDSLQGPTTSSSNDG